MKLFGNGLNTMKTSKAQRQTSLLDNLYVRACFLFRQIWWRNPEKSGKSA